MIRRSAGRRRALELALWVLGALAAVALALTLVDVEEVGRALVGARRETAAAAASAAVAVLAARGLALKVALDVLGHPVSVRRALGTYVAVAFVGSVAPSGQTGGAPASGLLVARSADADYETGVAATLGVSALNNLAIGLSGLVGVGYLVAGVSFADHVALAAAAGVALFAAGGVAALAAWRFRRRLGGFAVRALTAAASAVGRALPRTRRFLPDRAAVERRVHRFGRAVGRLLAGTPRQIAALVGLTALAHGLSVTALWLSLAAVGQSVSIGLLFAVVPAAVLAAVTPLPGGTGGVDLALIALLASATDAAVSALGAGVVLYRAATFWPRALVGGAVAAALLLFD